MTQGKLLRYGTMIAVMAAVLLGGWWVLERGAPPPASVALAAEQSSPDPDFDRRVRDALLRNPEIIVEALEILRAREAQTAQNELGARLTAHREELTQDPMAPVGGNPRGDVTLVEFFDYNCPYCRKAAPVLTEAIEADPDLRIVYKEFPILGPGSTYAAQAALAAQRQGKYEAFHRALMDAESRIGPDEVLAVAGQVGLNVERLKRDMEDPEIQQAIARNLDLANSLGIRGTPTFVVGDQLLPGLVDLNTLQRSIANGRKP